MIVAADFFHALGEPNRLKIVRQLSSGMHYTITTMSQGLPISRQAVRRHLQVLADAKIIRLSQKGRETEIELERATLAQAKTFITELELHWDKRLEALRDFVEE